MAPSKNTKTEKIEKDELETQQPISEKDEVKKAEQRTQELQKKATGQKKK